MDGQPFLTRPLSVCLDAVRFGAAFLVMVGHAAQLGLYTGPYPFTPRLQLNCVVVFFVLSGLVIASSVQRDGATLTRYAIARSVRLLTVAIAAVAFSSFAYLVGQWTGMHDFHGPKNGHLDLVSTLTPLLFLSEGWFGTGPVWNPPYWSLCFEAWFYAVFGVFWFVSGWRRWAGLLVCGILAGPNVPLLLPVWLIGVWTARAGGSVPMTSSRAILMFAVCVTGVILLARIDLALLFWLRPLVPWPLGQAEWVLSDILLGFMVAAGIISLRPFAECHAAAMYRAEPAIRWAAGCSFTIYLFHWPMICLLRALGVTQLTNPVDFALVLAGLFAACAVIAQATERRTPALRAAIERLLDDNRGRSHDRQMA